MTGDKVERLSETTLSDREAQVVARRIEGDTFHEIADELDISPQNANKAWQRAKRKAVDAKESTAVFRDVGLIE